MDEDSDGPGAPGNSSTGDPSSDADDAPRAELDEPTSGAAADTARTIEEEAALRRVRAVSRLLDEAVRVPGTNVRVGLDPVLGIVPGAGDAVAAVLSLYPIAEAYRLGVPKLMLGKMLVLVAVDATVGSIPVLGPVFDAFWKANEWNRRSLERHLEQSR